MKNTPYYFTLFLLLSLYSCSFDEEVEVEFDENGKAMCGSVDECLAIYDFERARKFIGKGESPEMYPDFVQLVVAPPPPENSIQSEKVIPGLLGLFGLSLK